MQMTIIGQRPLNTTAGLRANCSVPGVEAFIIERDRSQFPPAT